MPPHRRGMFLIAFLVFCAGASQRSAAQEEVMPKDPVIVSLDARVAQFLEGVSLGQSQSAFRELLSGSQLLKQTDALKSLIAQTNELETKYGSYRAFEQILSKRIGDDLVLMRYLYKCENFPVVWYFTFYRAPSSEGGAIKNGKWRAVALRFDTDLDRL